MLKLGQTQRYRGCTCIAIVLYVYNEFFTGNIETLGYSLDNAKVGLMGYEVVYVFDGEVVAAHNIVRWLYHIGNGVLENEATILINVVLILVDGSMIYIIMKRRLMMMIINLELDLKIYSV